jgi:thiosulfate dehydrogenase [quinone] large subunit
MSAINQTSTLPHFGAAHERKIIFLLRILMSWVFLYSVIEHWGDHAYVGGFLSHTKTFNAIYGAVATSSFLPVIDFLVRYGLLLIGLSLLFGFLVRISSPFGALVMLLFWTAHMDFPYIEDHNNYLLSYHLIYALVLLYFVVRGAGHVAGLDGWASKLDVVKRNDWLRWMIG